MFSQGCFGLKPAFALVTRLRVDKCTRVGLDFQVLALDVCCQCLGFPKMLVAGRVLGAVELGLMDVLVSLESAIRGETLPTILPFACV